MKRDTKEKYIKLAEKYERSNLSITGICEQNHATPSTLSDILKERGTIVRRIPRTRNEEKCMQSAINFYIKNSCSAIRAAKLYNIDSRELIAEARKLGVYRQPKSEMTPEVEEKIIEDYKNGMSGTKIQNQEYARGIGSTLIYNVINDFKNPGNKNEKKNTKEFSVDIGKIYALHRAGWDIETIGYDMRLPEKTVREVIRKYDNGTLTPPSGSWRDKAEMF